MAKQKPSDAETAPSFEEALAELEAIVTDLEEGTLGLGDAMTRYEQGVKHLRRCHGLLEEAQRKIELDGHRRRWHGADDAVRRRRHNGTGRTGQASRAAQSGGSLETLRLGRGRRIGLVVLMNGRARNRERAELRESERARAFPALVS